MLRRLPRLLDPQTLQERARLQPARLRVELRLNQAGSAMMETPESAGPVGLDDLAEFYDGAGESLGLFRCRETVLNAKTGGQTTRWEHVLSYLAEEVQPGLAAPGEMSCQEALAALLGQQQNPRFAPGGTDFDTACEYDLAPGTILSAIREVGATLPGDWMLRVDCSVRPWTLGLSALSTQPQCELRLRRNVRDLRLRTDTYDLATRLYPMGRDGLMLPEGCLDSPLAAEWGIRSRIITDAGIRRVSHLRAFGQAALARLSRPTLSLRCEMSDLSALTGEPLDHPALGALCSVCLPDHHLTLLRPISAITYPDLVSQPETAVVQIAEREAGLVEE